MLAYGQKSVLLSLFSGWGWFPGDLKWFFSSTISPWSILVFLEGNLLTTYSTMTASFLCSCVFIQCKWRHIVCVLLHLAFFVSLNIMFVKFIPHWYMYKCSLLVRICLYEYHSLFLCFPRSGNLGCVKTGATCSEHSFTFTCIWVFL